MTGFALLWDYATSPHVARAAAMLLSVPFAIGGVSKFALPAEASAALVSFRLVRTRRHVLAYAAGSIELCVALLLAFAPSQQVGGICAAALSITLAILVGRALAQGESFSCGCFGGHDPLDRWTLVRLLLLLVGAIPVSASSAALTGPLSAATGFLVVLVAVGWWFLLEARGHQMAFEKQLDERLDWEWILQQHGTLRDASARTIREVLYR